MTVPHTADVLVIGGGATGAGVLRDLARRGPPRRCSSSAATTAPAPPAATTASSTPAGAMSRRTRSRRASASSENRVLRRIAPASVEDTGGYFVATPDDPDDYVEAFAANCAASGVDCEEVDVGPLLAKEPALNRRIRRAFRVPDGSIEPWQLIEATLADARPTARRPTSYHRVIGFDVTGGRIVAALAAQRARRQRDARSGSSSSSRGRGVGRADRRRWPASRWR